MAFKPVNELEKLLVAASTDASARPAFLRAMLESDLYIISDDAAPDQTASVSLEAGDSVSIRAIDVEGKPHIPIFSSVERMQAVIPQETGYIGLKGRGVFEMLRGSDLILNPGSDYGKIFFASEVESILSGEIFQAARSIDMSGKQILLGQPKVYPHHVVDPLRALFEKTGEVKAAYLAYGCIAETGQPPHAIIGIELAGDSSQLMENIGVVIRESARPEEIVDVVIINNTSSETIASYMKKETKPFYQKKKWLGIFN